MAVIYWSYLIKIKICYKIITDFNKYLYIFIYLNAINLILEYNMECSANNSYILLENEFTSHQKIWFGSLLQRTSSNNLHMVQDIGMSLTLALNQIDLDGECVQVSKLLLQVYL